MAYTTSWASGLDGVVQRILDDGTVMMDACTEVSLSRVVVEAIDLECACGA